MDAQTERWLSVDGKMTSLLDLGYENCGLGTYVSCQSQFTIRGVRCRTNAREKNLINTLSEGERKKRKKRKKRRLPPHLFIPAFPTQPNTLSRRQLARLWRRRTCTILVCLPDVCSACVIEAYLSVSTPSSSPAPRQVGKSFHDAQGNPIVNKDRFPDMKKMTRLAFLFVCFFLSLSSLRPRNASVTHPCHTVIPVAAQLRPVQGPPCWLVRQQVSR